MLLRELKDSINSIAFPFRVVFKSMKTWEGFNLSFIITIYISIKGERKPFRLRIYVNIASYIENIAYSSH